MRGDAWGWSGEINYTRLIRKEVCSDCIKSPSPNITQTLSTPAKLFQSGLSCLKLSVTSSVEVGLAIFQRACDGVEGKGGIKVPSPHFRRLWVFCHYSKKHQFVPPTSHSTEMVKLKPISKHEKAPNAKESHQKFAEELLERTKTQTSTDAPSI